MAQSRDHMNTFRSRLQNRGFNVEAREAKYRSIYGGTVTRGRIVATSRDGLVKVSIEEERSGIRVTVHMFQSKANEANARAMENAGASVDLDEGERMIAVFKNLDQAAARRIIDEVSGRA